MEEVKLTLNMMKYIGHWWWDEYDDGEPSLDCPVCQITTDFNRSYYPVSFPEVGVKLTCPACLTTYTVIRAKSEWGECEIESCLQPESMLPIITNNLRKRSELLKIWKEKEIEDYPDTVPSYVLVYKQSIIAYTYDKTIDAMKNDRNLMEWLDLWHVPIEDIMICNAYNNGDEETK